MQKCKAAKAKGPAPGLFRFLDPLYMPVFLRNPVTAKRTSAGPSNNRHEPCSSVAAGNPYFANKNGYVWIVSSSGKTGHVGP